jgi:hypothetical protein
MVRAPSSAEGIAVDATGVYVAMTGETGGGYVPFLYKYGTDGNELWNSGTLNYFYGYGVAVNPTGVYVAGTLEDFDLYGFDTYVAKYDASGAAVWDIDSMAKYDDGAYAIAADPTNVYVTGDATLTVGGMPGPTLAYVAKYDADRNEIWRQEFGKNISGRTLAVDATGVYVAGSLFVRKYDAEGNELWDLEFQSGVDYSAIRALAADGTGVYVVGDLITRVPAPTYLIYSAILRKYSNDGTLLWSQPVAYCRQGYALTVDEGGVLLASATSATLPGQTSAGGFDAYLRGYDADGNEIWTYQFGTSDDDYPHAIAVDAKAIYVAGEWDTSGAWGAFTAKVLKVGIAPIAIEHLETIVQELNLKQGIANSLEVKLQNALKSLVAENAGQRQDAANKIQAFINACEAQRALLGADTDKLIAAADAIISMLQ